MRILILKFYWIINICICCLCLYSGCFNFGERKGRINPFDPDGDNWFPPNIDIVETYKKGNINDPVQIQVLISDKNGNVKLIKWESGFSGFINRIDSVNTYEDTTEKYDTTINSHEDSIGTIDLVDTNFYKIVKYFKKNAIHKDTTVYTFVIDTLDTTNTVNKSISTNSDTSFFSSETNNDSIFMAIKKDSIVFKTVFDTTVTLIEKYFSYTSQFSINDTGSFYLFATAVDNDGLESEYRDSILLYINKNR